MRARWLAAGLMLAAIIIVIISQLAWRASHDRAVAAMQDDLGLARQAVLSHLRTYEQLPSVLALDSRVIRLLNPMATADEAAPVSQFLEAVRERTSASEIFLMNQDGLTLASSNHDGPLSFVGRNYQFRPYFMEALQTGQGGMFAIGATTGVPGYFMAQRIRTVGFREGVIVVKIDLQRIVERWQSAREDFFIADGDGVVFLSTRPDDLYRPVRPLAHDALFRLQASRSYERVSANLKSPLISATATENPNVGPDTSFTADDGRLIGTAELGVHGWTIHTVTTRAALRETALALSALALFAIALVGAGVIIARQRLGLVRLQRAQNRMLEVKVTTRTRELRDEIEERKRAETALRQTQDQLIEAAKLAALGKMSAAIAHEVSQPLAALETTLASARIHAKRDDKPALDGKLVAATDMTGRLRRMLKHLKSFARRGQRVVKPVQISATIQSALAVLEPKTKEVGAAITARCPEELFAQADDIQLQQVVVNVLANALDAVQDLQTRDVSISARKHDETIVIDVRDSGLGLGTMTMDEAFEPFATSKITGEGLGLGLAITREIVEHHGGEVSIGDHVDGGAVVTITLAAADALKPSKTAPQTA